MRDHAGAGQSLVVQVMRQDAVKRRILIVVPAGAAAVAQEALDPNRDRQNQVDGDGAFDGEAPVDGTDAAGAATLVLVYQTRPLGGPAQIIAGRERRTQQLAQTPTVVRQVRE